MSNLKLRISTKVITLCSDKRITLCDVDECDKEHTHTKKIKTSILLRFFCTDHYNMFNECNTIGCTKSTYKDDKCIDCIDELRRYYAQLNCISGEVNLKVSQIRNLMYDIQNKFNIKSCSYINNKLEVEELRKLTH